MTRSWTKRYAVAIAVLSCLHIAPSAAAVDEATISLSGPSVVFVGHPFTVGVDVQLPASFNDGLFLVTAEIFHFPYTQMAPNGGVIVLDNVTAGSLLSPASYTLSVQKDANPYQGEFQAAAFLNDGGMMTTAPASGRLLDLHFSVAPGFDGIGAAHDITVEVGLFGFSSMATPEQKTISVTVLQTSAVPEASTAMLIVAGLVLVMFGRRKLLFSPRH
ncbi:MAG: hypothetical protein C5B46_03710 [Proteobacteria bacterium]|nr:MAG: hypothetical protein C5B46_03710 [Pseudomonadota bacterium]